MCQVNRAKSINMLEKLRTKGIKDLDCMNCDNYTRSKCGRTSPMPQEGFAKITEMRVGQSWVEYHLIPCLQVWVPILVCERSLFHVVKCVLAKTFGSQQTCTCHEFGLFKYKVPSKSSTPIAADLQGGPSWTLLDDPLHLIIAVVEQGSVSHWRECILSQHHVKKVQGHGTFASLQSDLQLLSDHQLELPSGYLT